MCVGRHSEVALCPEGQAASPGAKGRQPHMRRLKLLPRRMEGEDASVLNPPAGRTDTVTRRRCHILSLDGGSRDEKHRTQQRRLWGSKDDRRAGTGDSSGFQGAEVVPSATTPRSDSGGEPGSLCRQPVLTRPPAAR